MAALIYDSTSQAFKEAGGAKVYSSGDSAFVDAGGKVWNGSEWVDALGGSSNYEVTPFAPAGNDATVLLDGYIGYDKAVFLPTGQEAGVMFSGRAKIANVTFYVGSAHGEGYNINYRVYITTDGNTWTQYESFDQALSPDYVTQYPHSCNINSKIRGFKIKNNYTNSSQSGAGTTRNTRLSEITYTTY